MLFTDIHFAKGVIQMDHPFFHRAAAAVLAAAAAFSLSGCSVAISGKNTPRAASSSSASSSSKSNGKASVSAENAVFGEVTAVNGNEITLAVGTMDLHGGMMGGTMPGGDGTASGTQGTAPQMPGGDGTASGTQGTAPQMPGGDGTASGTQGTAPQMPGGDGTASGTQGTVPQMPGGGTTPGGLLTESGQTLTITITDTSILSRQNFGKDASASSDSSVSLSDITVGTYLAVTLGSDGVTPSSVVIFSALQSRDRTGGGSFGKGGSTAGGDTASSSSTAYKTV